MSNGVFTFRMKERFDRDDRMYLFAGLTVLDMVLFIRPDPHEPHTWNAELKPYKDKLTPTAPNDERKR